MKALSLFDGAGGLYMALKKLGVVPTLYVSSEIDKHARAVTRARIPDFIEAGDIRNLKIKDGMLLRGTWDEEAQDVVGPYTFICTGDFDLITAGSPCQGFSFSGIQKGLQDPRSKLFWHFVRLIREGAPKYWLLENVVMKQEFKDIITNELEVQPMKLDSRLFTAQKRKRLYWCNWEVENNPIDLGVSLSDILEGHVPDKYYYNPAQIEELSESGRITFSPAGAEFGIHPAAQRGRYKINGVRQDGKGSIAGKSHQHIEIRGDDKSNCLTTVAKDSLVFIAGIEDKRKLFDGKNLSRNYRKSGHTGLYLIDSKVRRLTPVECERLQGWPDGWASDIVSPTQTHKLTGNGWNVPTIAHILKPIV